MRSKAAAGFEWRDHRPTSPYRRPSDPSCAAPDGERPAPQGSRWQRGRWLLPVQRGLRTAECPAEWCKTYTRYTEVPSSELSPRSINLCCGWRLIATMMPYEHARNASI